MTYAPQSVTATNTALLELDGEKALGPRGLVRGGLAYRKLHTLTGNKKYDLYCICTYMMSIVTEICILSTIHSTPHIYEDN